MAPMATGDEAFQKAMRLAAVSGLRSMLGPALVATATRRPERDQLIAAAVAEMVLDKIPLMPSRASLLPLVARGLAGAWVANTIMKEEGEDNPWAVPIGAAVAMGVAAAAPRIRGLLRVALGVPDVVLGLAEDALAIKLGADSVGITLDEVKGLAGNALSELPENLRPAIEELKGRFLPTS